MPDYAASKTPAGLRFAKCQLHGVLVQVFGVGILLVGEAGIGKTMCAIELLRRGHSLIADDAVTIFQRDGRLSGRAAETTRSLIHVRGIGILEVADLFHRSSLLDECRIDSCIEIYDSTLKLPSVWTELPVQSSRVEAASPTVVADRIESIARAHACYSQR